MHSVIKRILASAAAALLLLTSLTGCTARGERPIPEEYQYTATIIMEE